MLVPAVRDGPGESWRRLARPVSPCGFREQTHCGDANSETTTGLVAYLAGEAVGWCAHHDDEGRSARRTSRRHVRHVRRGGFADVSRTSIRRAVMRIDF